MKELGEIRRQERDECQEADFDSTNCFIRKKFWLDAPQDTDWNTASVEGKREYISVAGDFVESEGHHLMAAVQKPASSRRANVVNLALLDIIGTAAFYAGVSMRLHKVPVLKTDGEPVYGKDGTSVQRSTVAVPRNLYELVAKAGVRSKFTYQWARRQPEMLEAVVDQIFALMRDKTSGRAWLQEGSELLANILVSYADVMRAAGVKYENTRLGMLLNYLVSIEQTERMKSKETEATSKKQKSDEAEYEKALKERAAASVEDELGTDIPEADVSAESDSPRASAEEALGRRVREKVRKALRQFKPANDPDGSKGRQARSEFFVKTEALSSKDAIRTPVARFRERLLAKDEDELAPEVWTKEQQTASKETNRGFFQKLTDHGLKFNARERIIMHAFTKNEVKGLFGKEGKRKAYTGTFEPAHADALAETLVRTTFFPTILKPGESRDWIKRVRTAAGEFLRDEVGDVIGYRAILHDPLDGAYGPMGVVENVLKKNLDREYARYKVTHGGRVEDLKIQQNAIKDAAGTAMVRSPKVFSHAFRVGLGKIIYGVADTRTAWTAMEDFESRVHDVLDQLNIKEKDRAKLDALMRENMDLAKEKLGVTEAIEKAFALSQAGSGPLRKKTAR